MGESKAANFEYFISMTLRNKIPWNMLLVFLDDLTPTLVKSKQAIEILVKHLQSLHEKLKENKSIDGAIEVIESDNLELEVIETEKKDEKQAVHEIKSHTNRNVQDNLDQSNQISDIDEKQQIENQSIDTEVINMELAVDIQKEVEERNSIASSEMSDSEDDSLEDTIEAIDDDQDICVDQSDQNDRDLNLIEIREAESLLDKVGKQLYEFVGDPKEDTDDYNIPKELNQMDATKKDEQHIESNERHQDDEFILNVEDKIGPYKCNKCTKSYTTCHDVTGSKRA